MKYTFLFMDDIATINIIDKYKKNNNGSIKIEIGKYIFASSDKYISVRGLTFDMDKYWVTDTLSEAVEKLIIEIFEE